MNWRDNLRAASFRGVEFFFSSIDDGFGRRLATHVYPGRDDPWHEDMGRKTREHRIEAYVLEPDHLVKAAALEAAIEKAGPGTLVHPVLGDVRVVCTNARRRITTREGGMAVFSLTFEKTADNTYPAASIATDRELLDISDATLLSVQTAFEDGFNVLGLPELIATDAEAQLTSIAGTIGKVLGVPRRQIQSLAAFATRISSIKSAAGSLVRQPGALSSELAAVIGLFDSISPEMAAAPLQRLSGQVTALDPIPGATPMRQTQATNRTAMDALVRRTAIVEGARVASSRSFDSRADVVTAQADLVAGIESEMQTADDASYRALGELRTALVRDLTARAAITPRLVTFTPTTTRPALALAQDYYGDDPAALIARADEITTRNQVRHPGFVPAGPLEVRTNA